MSEPLKASWAERMRAIVEVARIFVKHADETRPENTGEGNEWKPGSYLRQLIDLINQHSPESIPVPPANFFEIHGWREADRSEVKFVVGNGCSDDACLEIGAVICEMLAVRCGVAMVTSDPSVEVPSE